jgi:hypothetical protein
VQGTRYHLLDKLRGNPDWGQVYADSSFLIFIRRVAVEPVWYAKKRLSERSIDKTILSRAEYLVTESPLRPRAYWEGARVLISNKDYCRY